MICAGESRQKAPGVKLMQEKPIILIVGNCQSSILGNFLGSLPEIGHEYEIVRFRNYYVKLGDPASGANIDTLPDYIKQNRNRIRVFVQQASHNWIGGEIGPSDFEPDAHFISYPVCLMNYLWPLAVHDPRVEDLPPNIRTSFPYTLSDTLVVKLAREGVPESEFIDAYMGHDIPRMFKLDRLRAFNAAKMRAIDRMSTFSIWDHIEARNASEQMFRTLNHPSGALMAELARRVAESLPLVTDMKVVEQRVAEIAAGPGVQNVDAPVHPQVAEHFDVAWAKRDAYHFWDEGVFSFRENLLRLYRLERDTGVMDGLRLLSTGKYREAAELLTEVVERRPRSAKAREALASAHELLKQPEPAAANRAIAFEIDPTAKRADRAVRSLALAGRRDEANRLLDRAQALLGDGGADMAMAKIWMLANEGKPQEAHDNAEAASRLYADPELYLLLSKMRLTNGLLTESVEAMERAYYLSGYRDDYVRHLERARSDAASRQAVLDNTKRRQEEAEARRDASVKAQQTRQAAMNAAKEQRDAARAAAIDAAARRAEAVRAEAEANRSAKEDAQREAQSAREAARQAAEEENRRRAEAKQAEAEQKRAAQEEARRQAQAAREAVAEEKRIRAEAQRAEAEAKRAAQEEARRQAQAAREAIAEENRLHAEAMREEAEEKRAAQAEARRQAQAAREAIAEENQRRAEAIREEAEEKRAAQAEARRQAQAAREAIAEENRRRAEAALAEAERKRAEAEAKRAAQAEARRQALAAREALAEDNRLRAEAARAEAERKRAEAEAKRTGQEEARRQAQAAREAMAKDNRRRAEAKRAEAERKRAEQEARRLARLVASERRETALRARGEATSPATSKVANSDS